MPEMLEMLEMPQKIKGLDIIKIEKVLKKMNIQSPIEMEEKEWMGKLNYQRLYVNINKLDFI